MNELNESALKARLQAVAIEKKTTVNQIWKQLLLERFLARLSVSRHQNKFIFKGGMLLAQYIEIGRETIDLDFLMTKLKAEAKKLELSMTEILEIDIEDGFHFKFHSIKELSQPHMSYSGFRIILTANFKKMKDNIQIDIGVGDVVSSVEVVFKQFRYKGNPVFSGEISLRVYPPEFVFSEKLQSIVSKGIGNSRLKDYHDLILMIREPGLLDSEKLSDAVRITFQQRKTQIKLPIQFDSEATKNLQEYWKNHLSGLGGFRQSLNLPDKIADVILELNSFLKVIIV